MSWFRMRLGFFEKMIRGNVGGVSWFEKMIRGEWWSCELVWKDDKG